VVKKALVCRICNACPPRASRVTSDRSDGQQEQSRARLRTYEATQAPWLHVSRIPSRGSGNAGNLGRRRHMVSVSQTGDSPELGDRGCSSIGDEEGSMRISGSALCVSRSTCPSLDDARPMLPGEVIPRAPSLHRGGRHQAHRPRLERGDAPARGTRRGSTEGMAPWRHLTAGLNPAALVRTLAVSASAPDRQNSRGWKHSARENEVTRSPVSSRWCKSPGRHTLRKQ
jgi:hypothetical protein